MTKIIERMTPIVLSIMRVLIGSLFLFSGYSKLIRPVEYFQFSINQYQIIPDSLVGLIGFLVPWAELILGCYFLVGLWTFASGLGLFALTFLFQLIMAQAIVRQLPIDSCGCFGGSFLQLSLFHSFIIDTVLLLLIIRIATAETTPFSIDNYFSEK